MESKYLTIALLVELLDQNSKIAYPASSASGGQIEEIFSQTNMKIIRQNLYKPNSTLESNKIKEIICSYNPNAIVFLSAASAKLFIENFLKYDINQSELLNAGPIVSIK